MPSRERGVADLLGPAEEWPPALRCLAALVQDAAAPQALLWGPRLACLHNSAFLPLLPGVVPARGRAFESLWAEGSDISPLVRAALAGQAGRIATLPRQGAAGESAAPAFFDLLASPARDDTGAIAGVLLTAFETTRAVLTERRDAFLLDLDTALRDLDSPEGVLALAAARLGAHLQAARCAFGEVDGAGVGCTVLADWTDGRMPSAVGTHALESCGLERIEALRAGHSLGIGEPEAGGPFLGGLQGSLTVPLLKQGRLAALLQLHHPGPRRWTAAEAELARDVAERVWSALKRRQAEAGLRLGEARLRRVQQIGRVGGFEIDLTTGRNVRSAEYMDLQGLGPTAADERHADWVQRLHPEDRVRAERRYLDAISDDSGATEYAQEYRIRTPGHGLRWIAARAEIERDDQGRALRMLGAHVDVTELKVAEAALAESVQRAREVLESLGDMLYALDAEGRIRFASRRALEMWGMRTEQVLGQPFLDLFPAVRGSISWQVIEAAMAGGQEVHFCASSPLVGRWFELNVHPAQGGGVTVAARDVEGRRQAEIRRRSTEAALRASEERLRLAQDAGQVGTWEWDVRSGAVHWSASCHRLYGTNPETAASISVWRDGVDEQDRPAVDAQLRRVLTGEVGRWAAEFRFRRISDGALRWISERGELVRDPRSGLPLRLLGISQDVTERREADERQTLLMRELDHRAKNALAVVQAAVRMTPKEDPDAFATAVLGRIGALARAHTLLAQGRWDGVGLRELVQGEMAPFLSPDGLRVRLEGPPVVLAPTAAQAISMALHELATNATKHGALSVPEGQVVLDWATEPGQSVLRLRWAETGGPVILAPPARHGFGSRVLEATIAGQLGGRIVLLWQASGLVCEMTIPLSRAAIPDFDGELG
ncbi:PAS domain S-box protein [Falsiroseomonas tokyonensis]|uniref:histidine kinase n=1 Tax=Falsiroseomonas tokyonensis TaxID=430521 RepID=A0ABV7C3X9_9PROT|nr:PAS domain S-box protein [Falsiroseomonas tokyonensis]MBU8541599.1 PAS domain S-box protein [Falsiroseomonas tokyonensis]